MSASPQTAAPHPTLISAPRAASHVPRRTARANLGATAFSLLAAWHLLSLDAPTVAALWLVFVARAAHVTLPWTTPAAMFVAVWILYAMDRLLDARSLHPGKARVPWQKLEARHRFHHRHRAAFVAALSVAVPVLAWLLRHAKPAALQLYLLLGTILLAWLVLIHLRPTRFPDTRSLPKEFAVGLFFPAALFVPTVARVPAIRVALLPDALLFAAVCCLNCLFIYAWEHPQDRSHAHWSTRWGVQHLTSLSLGISAVGLICAVFFAAPHRPHTFTRALALPCVACILSAILLFLLHRLRERIPALTLRAAADACLLTPALLMLGEWLLTARA